MHWAIWCYWMRKYRSAEWQQYLPLPSLCHKVTIHQAHDIRKKKIIFPCGDHLEKKGCTRWTPSSFKRIKPHFPKYKSAFLWLIHEIEFKSSSKIILNYPNYFHKDSWKAIEKRQKSSIFGDFCMLPTNIFKNVEIYANAS